MFTKLMYAVLAIIISANITSVATADEVFLPAMQEVESTYFIESSAFNSEAFHDWVSFKDEITGNIRKAFGTPIKYKEFGDATENNVELIADRFFSEYSSEIGIDYSNVRLTAKLYANNRWHLKYRQYYNNMEVVFSDISLTIFKNGNIMAFGAEYYDNIDVPSIPKISYQTAVQNASSNITKEKVKDILLSKPELKILPYIKGNNVSYRLVYEHQYETNGQKELFTSLVDANTGNVLWRFSNLMSSKTEFQVRGLIQEKHPTDEQVSKPFKDAIIYQKTSIKHTNKEGKVDFGEEPDFGDFATLKGKYVTVYGTGQSVTSAGIESNLIDGVMEWNDDISTFYERNLYYHTNVVHDYFKSIDPNQTFLDFPVEVSLYSGYGSPNAASGGDYIYFINVDNTNYAFAGGGSVLYHEYGHSMNRFQYMECGSDYGMINSACNEALADITSAAILDESRIGLGTTVTNRADYIRDINNTKKYPKDINSDSHKTALILSGALWDLYKMTDMKTLNNVSHYAKYEIPDDSNFGNSCIEWLVSCLIADDNDGNLANGTPHYNEIISAFDMHNIGMNLLIQSSFNHQPKLFYSKEESTYAIDFRIDIESKLLFLQDRLEIEKAEVVYSPWKGGSSSSVEAVKNSDGTFTAEIPAQEEGTILRYQINIKQANIDANIQCVSADAYKDYDLLFVGYTTTFEDDFETDKGWKVGSDADNATRGEWERAIPEEILFYSYYIFQPGNDHSEDGEYCLVTDKNGGMEDGDYYTYARGKTTVVSPKIDMSGATNPILRYFDWVATYNYSEASIGSFLYVSNNDGDTWRIIDILNGEELLWDQRYVELSKFVTEFTDNMRFKFVANGYLGPNSRDYAVLETLVDDFLIIDVPHKISVTERTEAVCKIYPNPAASYLQISNDTNINQIEIYDMMGNRVFMSSAVNSNSFSWDLSDMMGNRVANGTYYIRISDLKGSYIDKAVIR